MRDTHFKKENSAINLKNNSRNNGSKLDDSSFNSDNNLNYNIINNNENLKILNKDLEVLHEKYKPYEEIQKRNQRSIDLY